MTKTAQEGGVDWELSKALDLAAQGRIDGDPAKEALGWLRFSEGLRNLTGASMAAQLVPMMLELRSVHNERTSDAASAEQRITLLLDQADIEQGELGRHSARLGLIDAAAAAALVAFAVAQAEIIVLTARVRALEDARDADLEAMITALRATRKLESAARAVASTSEGQM